MQRMSLGSFSCADKTRAMMWIAKVLAADDEYIFPPCKQNGGWTGICNFKSLCCWFAELLIKLNLDPPCARAIALSRRQIDLHSAFLVAPRARVFTRCSRHIPWFNPVERIYSRYKSERAAAIIMQFSSSLSLVGRSRCRCDNLLFANYTRRARPDNLLRLRLPTLTKAARREAHNIHHFCQA